MSVNKYANLPDIDTAPDVYETEDVFPSAQDNKGDSSEDESNAPTRSHPRGKSGEASGKEELDASSLMGTKEASKRFRKAERKHHRPRIQYTYPSSPTSSRPASPTTPAPSLPLSQRLRVLQTELAALETELADPSNPLLKEENEVEPGELIRGMVDVKRRLNKISKVKEGRGKLVSVVLGEDDRHAEEKDEAKEKSDNAKSTDASPESETKPKTPDVRDIVEIDHRVGELEKLIGSSTTALDELSPLPPPLLPMLMRLNAQMALLTQPRHIDSVSRRLKLLGSDLERVSNANAQQHGTQRRQPHHGAGPATSHPASPAVPSAPAPVTALDHLTPVLTRLAPLLPHIPHILTRLRTLGALHTSAAAFQGALEGLEEEQRRVHGALEELAGAVAGVEKSVGENETLVRGNVKELEERVESVALRVEELKTSAS